MNNLIYGSKGFSASESTKHMSFHGIYGYPAVGIFEPFPATSYSRFSIAHFTLAIVKDGHSVSTEGDSI